MWLFLRDNYQEIATLLGVFLAPFVAATQGQGTYLTATVLGLVSVFGAMKTWKADTPAMRAAARDCDHPDHDHESPQPPAQPPIFPPIV